MLKLFPHVHSLDVGDNGHPYLILTRFQNSCILSIYPSSSIGRVDSHFEPPCSVLISFSLHCYLLSLNSAIRLNTSISDMYCDTISSMYCFLNVHAAITDPKNRFPEFFIFTLVSLKPSLTVACVSGSVISHDFVGSGK